MRTVCTKLKSFRFGHVFFEQWVAITINVSTSGTSQSQLLSHQHTSNRHSENLKMAVTLKIASGNNIFAPSCVHNKILAICLCFRDQWFQIAVQDFYRDPSISILALMCKTGIATRHKPSAAILNASWEQYWRHKYKRIGQQQCKTCYESNTFLKLDGLQVSRNRTRRHDCSSSP